jgi:SAM-dependent methyltransferase
LKLPVRTPERLDATGTSLAERQKTFDDVAELYERFRPGYPERLADDVVWLSGIPPRGRILEIGCGSGKASALFADRGYRMLCLEPGLNLAGIAERKLTAYPDARVERRTFEEWQLEDSALDLVIAAQSFHYIEPASGLSKVARALRAGGAFAAFANHPARGNSEVHRRVQEAYVRHAPALARLDMGAGLEDRIDETGLFETVVMTRYRWQAVYTAAEYVGLMETQSHHRLLPRGQRAALLQAIHDAITGLGGSFTVDYATRLHLAKRRVTA